VERSRACARSIAESTVEGAAPAEGARDARIGSIFGANIAPY